MTGYMAAQALLKTLLLTCGSFGASDVVESDDRILDRGITNACILYPADMPERDLEHMAREKVWQCYADLFTKYVDSTSFSAFGTLRDAVIATLETGRCMTGTYFITQVAGSGAPSEVYERVSGQLMGPYFIVQRLRITIKEQV